VSFVDAFKKVYDNVDALIEALGEYNTSSP
jgi:hypothetical protein